MLIYNKSDPKSINTRDGMATSALLMKTWYAIQSLLRLEFKLDYINPFKKTISYFKIRIINQSKNIHQRNSNPF